MTTPEAIQKKVEEMTARPSNNTPQQAAQAMAKGASNEQSLVLQLYFKFLSDAANMIANNPSLGAQQARIKIEEALDWGRKGILMFQPAAPQPTTQAPTSETVTVANQEPAASVNENSAEAPAAA